ncbi:BT_3987 domain-containing protein [Limibacterium fermenti]|jgi:hypothetical protein|uniref:BT_3987 domain-containing protein n=1 Tax=Limibacterium fermenti TaxID=3229863 RepID=UPI000EDBEA31|nr:hypothetical protein [Porphyromonadaceae bacterium]
MKKIVCILLVFSVCFSCKNDDTYLEGTYLSLSQTNVDFSSDAQEQAVEIINAGDDTKAGITSENSDWCQVSIKQNQLLIKVSGNDLVTSRIAKIEVSSANQKVSLMVRQARKYFTHIAAVKNLQAIPGPGEVKLKWTEPEEDNFSHVVVTYQINNQQHKLVLENGVTEYTIKELLNADGEHTFYVQSVDKDRDLGEVASVATIPGKLVAFRFEKEIDTQWIPYYLRNSNNKIVTLRIGSAEFNDNEQSVINFEVDEGLLQAYREKTGLSPELLPADACPIPQDYVYTGTSAYQNLSLQVDVSALQDRHVYALPLKIKSVSSASVSEMMNSVVIVFYVDDLEGWYTVDRLAKCGEGAAQYPSNPEKRRRYIKRTGDLTWETGYLFRAYSTGKDQTSSGTSVQYISIDPDTKSIVIQQNGYPVSDNLNAYDLQNNELNVEYLYRDWAGWWTHERMYNRTLTR